MTLEQIWQAVESRKFVYWNNEGYIVHAVPAPQGSHSHPTHRNGKVLRVSFIANYFGSFLPPSEFENCHVGDDQALPDWA